jgi:hypothetical protein
MKATPTEMRVGFCLDKNNGKPFIPTDKQTDRLMKLEDVESVQPSGACGYFVICRVDVEKFSPEWLATKKAEIEKLLTPARKNHNRDTQTEGWIRVIRGMK